MKIIDVAILGFGARGHVYADFIQNANCGAKLVSVCDSNIKKLNDAEKNFSVKRELCFLSDEEFFKEKRADVLVISTQDADHYKQAMHALDLGYDILLEKPISASEKECIEIEKKAVEKGRKAAVCHVLRYTPFYSEIKKIITSGIIGEVVTVSQTENVSYWHQSHSFVRGNWRNSKTSSPMILAKCCHDLDIISWLIGKDCKTVSSFGSLFFFNAEHAPKNSGTHCYKCACEGECPYSCLKFYKKHTGWFNVVRALPVSEGGAAESENDIPNIELVDKLLSNPLNPYSRCVFKCDNDVVDHQVVNMLFEDNVTAQLTMTAFSADCTRTLRIHATYGEIEGDFEKRCFTLRVYGKEPEIIDLNKFSNDFSNHGGGDRVMFSDFIDLVRGNSQSLGLTSISKSVLSHRMAFAAERSRNKNGNSETL